MSAGELLPLILALLPALAHVESRGDPAAVGDGGKALGLYQIHRGVVEDVNDYAHADYEWEDVLDPDVAKHVAVLYLEKWGMHYWRESGRKPTLEVLARIWNGGPRGWEKEATLPYWGRVREALEKMGGGK